VQTSSFLQKKKPEPDSDSPTTLTASGRYRCKWIIDLTLVLWRKSKPMFGLCYIHERHGSAGGAHLRTTGSTRFFDFHLHIATCNFMRLCKYESKCIRSTAPTGILPDGIMVKSSTNFDECNRNNFPRNVTGLSAHSWTPGGILQAGYPTRLSVSYSALYHI
jgi:hypothetical protein